jgi:hypothetical protein
MSTPQEIQQRIEQTRASLSEDVNRLGDKVSPGRVVSRRVDRMKGSMSSLRDRVMGSSDEGSGVRGATSTLSGAASSVGNAASSVGDAASSVGDAASSVGDAASNAPQAVRRQAQGNPLAAGLVAFGVGWLLASMAPATDAERQVAQQAEDKARELGEPVKQQAQEIAQNLKEPAQQAVDEVRSTATDAASETAEQARSAADDVREPMQR